MTSYASHHAYLFVRDNLGRDLIASAIDESSQFILLIYVSGVFLIDISDLNSANSTPECALHFRVLSRLQES